MQPQVFALIIGIDQYEVLPGLKGSVNDANDLKDFLTQFLRVPKSHIKFITNRNATRANILSTFQTHLISNTAIRTGDAIIIFYAGHGSRVDTPNSRYNTSGKVETICPHDERCFDKKGGYIHGIPDYTVHTLLQKLAAAKGNNLTAIFDCCHAGGIGRSAHTYRFVESTVPIPEDLDSDLIGRAATTSLPKGFCFPFMESHVLLAACRDNQIAVETTFGNVSRGRFSESLGRTLRTASLEKTTYIGLMKLIEPWLDQNPQVEGKNKDRLLFNGRCPPILRKALPLIQSNLLGPQSFEIDIGEIEGVVVGTEFRVNDTKNKPICLLSAGRVELNRCFLVANGHLPEIPGGSTATVSDFKNEGMKMKICLNGVHSSVTAVLFPDRHLATPSLMSLPTPTKFQQANRPKSDIELRQSSEKVFRTKWLRGILKDTPVERFRFLLEPARYHRLPVILDAMAHFHYFLKRHGGGTIPNVTLEMHTVQGSMPPFHNPSPNIIRHNDKVAELKETEKYGFTILNRSPYDLFAYLFYFDPSEYSIQLWYRPDPPTNPPLPASPDMVRAIRLPIGYANGGYARIFALPPGKTADIGFVKVFLSTEPLNIDWIEQASPFDPRLEGSGRLTGGQAPLDLRPTWDTLLATVTM